MRKYRGILLFFSFTVSLIQTSCSVYGVDHKYYVQSPHQVNLFQDEGEFALTTNYSQSEEIKGFSINTGVSFSKHIGMNASFQGYKSGELNDENPLNSFKGNRKEISLNYFKKIKEDFILEIHGGIYQGSQEHIYTGVKWVETLVWLIPPMYEYIETPYQLGNANIRHYSYYLQPVFGFKSKSKYFQAALSLRFGNLNFYRSEYDVKYDANYDHLTRLESVLQRNNYVYMEPSLTLRAGLQNVKFQMQFTATGFNQKIYNNTYSLSAGLIFLSKN